MAHSEPPALRTADERALVVELTALALVRAAPDELAVLDETAQEYFADPAAALGEDEHDTPLGSGIDVVALTPYVLAAASAVLPVLGTITAEIAKDVAKDLVKDPVVDGVRRLVKRRPDEPPGPVALTRGRPSGCGGPSSRPARRRGCRRPPPR